MTTVLIVESNSPELLARGSSGAVGFVRSLMALAPDVALRVVAPYAEPVGADALDGVDAVIFTGSAVAWSTDAPQAAPLRAFMAMVFDQGRPTWGSCNGLQLAAVLLGGAVGASPHGMEIGVARDTTLTREGAAHPMLAGRAPGFAVPCIHRDEVQRLPEGAVLLAGNAHSTVQAMAYERDGVDFWGVQYHPELGARDIALSVRAKNIFDARDTIVADLDAAETDAGAATRIGTSVDELALPVRSLELANWLKHVRAVAAGPRAVA